jgi:uncharacterized protein YjiS (DUF1127 family)
MGRTQSRLQSSIAPGIHAAVPGALAAPGMALRAAAARFSALLELRRTRLSLAKLSDYELHDIGLTRSQARHEAGRPWWDG